MFSELPKNAMAWQATRPSTEQETDGRSMSGSQSPNDVQSPLSILRSILISCGGFFETATFFLRPSDCTSCVGPPSPLRCMRRSSSKKHSQNSLRPNPSREGEVVDVPIKLVNSKSLNKEAGEVDDSYRSFDDSISAISAHTLDEMAMRYPKSIFETLREGDDPSRPQNGDQLLPPPPEAISDSDSSSKSDEMPDDCKPTKYVENDIPFGKKLEPLKIMKMDTVPTYNFVTNDTLLSKNGLPQKSYMPRLQAVTQKSSSRKSRRQMKQMLEIEPQMAEI